VREIMRFLCWIALCLGALGALAEESANSVTTDVLKQANIEPPAGYVAYEYEEDNFYVLAGDGISALKAANSTGKWDDGYLEDWFAEGIIAYFKASSVDISEEDLTELEAHQALAMDLKSRWGEHSFSRFDPDTGIGWFVNYAGAIVAAASVKVGDTLYLVESLNLVEVVLVEERVWPDSLDSVTLWERYRKAANADTAEEVLRLLKNKSHKPR